MAVELLTPFLQDGIKNPNFFNGRILSAEDLRDEQEAHRRQRRLLGRSIGAGVVYGLEVSTVPTSSTTVNVKAGLALNRQGEVLELTGATDVGLVPEADEIPASAGLFVTCLPATTDTLYSGAGAYLLFLEAASGYEGKIPLHALNGNGVATQCHSRYVVEGVQFRLMKVDSSYTSFVSLNSAASRSRSRNRLAHLFLDSAATRALPADLFPYLNNTSVSESLLQQMSTANECGVPLALLYWTSSGIQILDMWPVRRRPSRAQNTTIWPPAVSDWRLANGEAVFLQFQAHIADLIHPSRGLSLADLAALEADNYFRYLPAAGVIPLSDGAGVRGFDYDTFFNRPDMSEPAVIPGATVETHLRNSFTFPPIDLQSEDPIQLYLIQENLDAADGTRTYLFFSHGNMPFLGETIGTEAVIITAVLPPGTLHINQEIEILGRNFGFSAGAQQVRFDTIPASTPIPVTAFKEGSNDRRLVIDMPNVPGLPEEGMDMTLVVGNRTTTDSWPVHVEPAEQPLEGNVAVKWLAVEPNPIASDEVAAITYALRSGATRTADFAITLDITPSAWEDVARVVDENGQTINEISLTPDALEPVIIAVLIEPVPPGSDGVTASVTLSLAAGDAGGFHSGLFVVTEETTPPDDAISFTPEPSTFLSNDDQAELVGGTIRMRAGFQAALTFTAAFNTAGTYQLLEPEIEAAGWQIGRDGTTPSQYIIEDADIPASGVAERSPVYVFSSSAASAADGTALLTIQREGAEGNMSILINLVVIATP